MRFALILFIALVNSRVKFVSAENLRAIFRLKDVPRLRIWGSQWQRSRSLQTKRSSGTPMLVLTRKPGQAVYIGDDIRITLMEIRGNQVRLGVEAPSSVRIYREEIYLQILEENKQALQHTSEIPGDLSQVAEVWRSRKVSAISATTPDNNPSSEDEE